MFVGFRGGLESTTALFMTALPKSVTFWGLIGYLLLRKLGGA
jgi:hypothetical protein